MAFEKLLHYRSTTPTAVPAAADMDGGQLAMNLADERIFIKNAAGSVVEPNPRAHTHTLDQITNATDVFQSIVIQDGEDLNTYNTPGIFHQAKNAGASSGQNYPAPAAGQLLVYAYSALGTPQFVYQIYLTYNGTGADNNKIFWRAYYYTTTPNAWSAWKEVLPAQLMGAANGIATLDANSKIPVSQLPTVYSSVLPTTAHDLNDYVAPNEWYQTTNAGAAAGTNYPVARAGFMTVIAAGSPVLQLYTTRDGGNTVQQRFMRLRLSEAPVWTPWQEIATEFSTIPYVGTMPSAADLNTYTYRSAWSITSSSVASSGTNYPTAESGYMIVQATQPDGSSTAPTAAHQTYYAANSNRVFFRVFISPNWQDWEEVLYVSEKGVANGVATLDADGQIPASQHLPNVVSTSSSSISISTIKSNTYTRLTNGAVPVTISVPASAAQSGDEFHFRQSGTAEVLFSAGSGVTINSPFGGTLTLAGPGATVTLKCIGTDLYDLMGQVLAA